MTTQEFSDAFDTLLASYNHKAEFGDQSSYADVTLDEYEKSVFLTQAQDNVVKNYFARQTNSLGEGFDDSTRRQVDFSSLIKVASLSYTRDSITTNVIGRTGSGDAGLTTIGTATIYNNTKSKLRVVMRATTGNGDPQFEGHVLHFSSGQPYNAKFFENDNLVFIVIKDWRLFLELAEDINENEALFQELNGEISISFKLTDTPTYSNAFGNTVFDVTMGGEQPFDERGIIFQMPKTEEGKTDVLFVLNEKFQCTINGVRKDFVIVPISYKEYDREMSRPFAQPLKKQAWRLFQNSSQQFDVYTELILKDNVINTADPDSYVYKIRYVKRPRPIVLEDLPNNLSVDGESIETPCELNPILHIDILEEAVRLALNSKGIETRDQKAAREAAKNRHN